MPSSLLVHYLWWTKAIGQGQDIWLYKEKTDLSLLRQDLSLEKTPSPFCSRKTWKLISSVVGFPSLKQQASRELNFQCLAWYLTLPPLSFLFIHRPYNWSEKGCLRTGSNNIPFIAFHSTVFNRTEVWPANRKSSLLKARPGVSPSDNEARTQTMIHLGFLSGRACSWEKLTWLSVWKKNLRTNLES